MGAGERVDRKGGVSAAPLVELVHLAKGAAELTAKVFPLPCYKTAGHVRPGGWGGGGGGQRNSQLWPL